MSDSADNDLSARVFEKICSAFPVSRSPYCDLGEELGAPEIDVLNAVEGLRDTGAISRIGADFVDLASIVRGAPSQDEADLAELLAADLPYSEHPFAELANELEERGIDASEKWVIDRTRSWLAEGTIVRLAAEAGWDSERTCDAPAAQPQPKRRSRKRA